MSLISNTEKHFIIQNKRYHLMDDNLSHAIRMFKHHECDEQVLVSRSKLTDILNKQAISNLKHPFNAHIVEQIWGQAETTSKGESTAYTFSKIYAQAMTILQQRINLIDGPSGIRRKQNQLISQQTKLQELQKLYQEGYSQNYDRINTTRKNIVTLQNKIKELEKQRDTFSHQFQEMKKCLYVEEMVNHHIQQSQYAQSILKEQEEIPNSSTPSPHLSLIFKLTLAVLCLQMLFFHFHQSFLPLLCYFAIINWLFLGYYDQFFVKTIISGLSLASCLDIVYICLQLTEQIGADRYYQTQKVWVYAATAAIIIELLLRVFIIFKLFMFREPTSKRQFFILFNREMELKTRSGKVFVHHNEHD